MRRPRPMTAGRIRFAAERYLERYMTSSSHLRDLLRERVRREAQALGADPEPWYELVDNEIAVRLASGALDDQRYATDRARRLQRRGSSPSKIRAALRTKGLSGEVTDTALDEVRGELEDEGIEDPEMSAALTFARKRKLGRFRVRAADREEKQREIGKLVRAGFGFGVARQIVDEDPDLPDESDEAPDDVDLLDEDEEIPEDC